MVFQGCFIVFHGPRLVLTFFQGSFMVLKIVSFLLPIICPEVHIWQTLCRVGMGPLKTLGKERKSAKLGFIMIIRPTNLMSIQKTETLCSSKHIHPS